jgi:hypothetical protein
MRLKLKDIFESFGRSGSSENKKPVCVRLPMTPMIITAAKKGASIKNNSREIVSIIGISVASFTAPRLEKLPM